LADFDGWRVRKASAVRGFSDRLVVQGVRSGMLDLSVCLLASGGAVRERLGLLRPLVAACTSEGIRRDTGIVSWLHWPDLVTIDGRVVAKTSISIAARPGLDGKAQVTLSISVNCFAGRRGDFHSALPSTSILDVLGVEIDLDLLRDKALHALNWYYAEWERGMQLKLAKRMQPTISWLGSRVEVRTAGGPALRGRAKAMDDLGSLLLEQDAGRKTLVIRPETVELVRTVK
jgi:biotin-(acetyl-CoA carboxylase) ligase